MRTHRGGHAGRGEGGARRRRESGAATSDAAIACFASFPALDDSPLQCAWVLTWGTRRAHGGYSGYS
jgi:hypothetical protein